MAKQRVSRQKIDALEYIVGLLSDMPSESDLDDSAFFYFREETRKIIEVVQKRINRLEASNVIDDRLRAN